MIDPTELHYSILKSRKGVDERIISCKRFQSCYLTVCGREVAQKNTLFKRGKRVRSSVLLSDEGTTILHELGQL